jgi:hypothetical protein
MVKKIVMFAVLAVLAVVIWGYSAPERSLEGLRAAARSGDAAALEEVVDFPALRESVKSQVEAAFQRRAAEPDGEALASFAAILGERIMEPTIDRLLTPEVIAGLASGRTQSGGTDVTDDEGLPDHEVDWVGLGAFRLHFPDQTEGTSGFWLEFQRQGVAWRLVGAGLPADMI